MIKEALKLFVVFYFDSSKAQPGRRSFEVILERD